MTLDLHVMPTGKNTAYTVLTQTQVDAIRGAPGRGRVNVVLRTDTHTFRTSGSIYRGEWMFVINKEMRAAGLLPGGTYTVELTRDTAPKRADPPPDLVAALTAADAQGAWAALSLSRRRQHIKDITSAKRPETRQRRIAKLVQALCAP